MTQDLHEEIKKCIPLAMRRAISFGRTIPGIELDELKGEALLRLVGAAERYKEDRPVKFSTYANLCINTGLIKLADKEIRHKKHHKSWVIQDAEDDESEITLLDYLPDTTNDPEALIIFKDLLQKLSPEAQFIVKMVLRDPRKFGELVQIFGQEVTRQKIAQSLLESRRTKPFKWTKHRIRVAIVEIEMALENTRG